MLVYFISVASVIAAGVATYFATTFKKERDDLKVKFEQAKNYADSTTKANTTLTYNVRTLTANLQTAEKNLQTAEKQIVDLKSVVESYAAAAANVKQPVVEAKQPTAPAPAMKAKKAGPGRPSKKVVA